MLFEIKSPVMSLIVPEFLIIPPPIFELPDVMVFDTKSPVILPILATHVSVELPEVALFIKPP